MLLTFVTPLPVLLGIPNAPSQVSVRELQVTVAIRTTCGVLNEVVILRVSTLNCVIMVGLTVLAMLHTITLFRSGV